MKIFKSCFIIIVLSISFFTACTDSVVTSDNFAVLNIETGTNDSVQISYDGKILVNRKLIYFGGLGYSWRIKLENEEIGIHKIGFKDFDHNAEAEINIYLEDTITVYVNYIQQENKIVFRTENLDWYNE